MMKTKKIFLLAVTCCLLSAQLWAGNNIFKINNATAIPGENITLNLEIINEDTFVAFQVDIPLPEGFGYIAGSFALTARSNGHLANANLLPGSNILRALAFSLTNTPFNGNSGIIATFSLTTPAVAGTYILVPTNAIISNTAGQQIFTGTVNGTITLSTGTSIIPGDANCDGNVNAIDIIILANYIMGLNPQPFCFENADANGDGIVNAIDVIGTVNIILGGGNFTCGVSTISDYDNNIYHTVLIGNQCWMKENLKTTHYQNGTPIEYTADNIAWMYNTTGAYSWYDNDISWKDSYGALYNWHAVNNANGICPSGWHVISDTEWNILILHIDPNANPNTWGIQSGIAGGKMKSISIVPEHHPRWESPNTGATNESNWTGLPGGYRYDSGEFSYVGYYGSWWSATGYGTNYAWYRDLFYSYCSVNRTIVLKAFGFSVRCVRN